MVVPLAAELTENLASTVCYSSLRTCLLQRCIRVRAEKKSNKINTVEVVGSTSTAFLLASLIWVLSLWVIE